MANLVQFFTPPLVEGPAIMFYVPLPEFLHKIPFAMQCPNGGYGLPVSATVTSTWFVIIVLAVIFKLCTKKMEVIPGRTQTTIESIYDFLHGIIHQLLGDWTDRYISFLGTLFFFILASNILSFFPIPWGGVGANGQFVIAPAFRSPTADLNTTIGLAALTTATFLGTGIKLNGVIGYLKGLLQPMAFMLPLNLIGEIAKPANISIRLFGNMFAGSVIMGLLYKAVPWIVPAPLHLYFDLFSGVVQSFVFLMLSMVYIQGAIGDTPVPQTEKN